MDIPLPYDLTEEQLVLEPDLHRFRLHADRGWDLSEELEWLVENGSPEAYELVFRGVVMLKHKLPEASFEDCLITSMIWYFG